MVFPRFGEGKGKSTRERERDTTRETQKSKDRSWGRGAEVDPMLLCCSSAAVHIVC